MNAPTTPAEIAADGERRGRPMTRPNPTEPEGTHKMTDYTERDALRAALAARIRAALPAEGFEFVPAWSTGGGYTADAILTTTGPDRVLTITDGDSQYPYIDPAKSRDLVFSYADGDGTDGWFTLPADQVEEVPGQVEAVVGAWVAGSPLYNADGGVR